MCVCVSWSRPAADDDGFITFEEFMVSYARPKPILKNLLIMAINTAVIFFILQAPWLDTMIKVSRVCWAAAWVCWGWLLPWVGCRLLHGPGVGCCMGGCWMVAA